MTTPYSQESSWKLPDTRSKMFLEVHIRPRFVYDAYVAELLKEKEGAGGVVHRIT
jgi:hypothetical protein